MTVFFTNHHYSVKMSGKIAIGFLLPILCAVSMAQGARRSWGPSVGGFRPVDINSPEAQEAARTVTLLLEAARNSPKAYRLARLISAESQIVAGTNYKLQLLIGQTTCNRGAKVSVANCPIEKILRCNVVMFVPLQSQPAELTSQSCGGENIAYGRNIARRSMLASVKVDVSSPEVVQAASFATKELTLKSGGAYAAEIQSIISADVKVGNGLLYTITMDVSLTYVSPPETKTTRCKVEVWDRVYLDPTYTLQDSSCWPYTV